MMKTKMKLIHLISRINLLLMIFTSYVNMIQCSSPMIGDRPWWKEKSVIYQIYPRSFRDSDGDGIGDLKGKNLNRPFIDVKILN